jgi:hypothetical protein
MKPIQIAGFSNPADVVNVVDSPAVGAPAASEAVISIDPQGTNAMTRRYLEDFAVGQTFGSGRVRVDGERIKSFAAEFDPQPFISTSRPRDTRYSGVWPQAAGTRRR